MQMTEMIWFFPALVCLCLSWTFSISFQWLGFLCSLLWLLRVCFLKNKRIIIWTLVIGFVFVVSIFIKIKSSETILDERTQEFVVYPDLTTIKVNGDRIRFEGTIQQADNQEKVMVIYRAETEKEKEVWTERPPLTHLKIKGQLKEPSGKRNFYQFDYRNYLKQQAIYWELVAEGITQVDQVNQENLKKPLGSQLTRIRHQTFNYIDQNFQSKTASYIRMLLFADKRSFSEEVLQSYRTLGILHLFSISGFHITYLVQLIRKLLLKLGVTHESTDRVILVVLPIYGLFAGLGVGVFRATVQTIILLGSRQIKRPVDSFNAWSITMLLALFINPYLIFQMSFQMSYVLSGLFILLSKQDWIQKLSALKSTILFSTLASLVSIPILTYHFYEIPWITIFANLLFVPIFSTFLFPSILFLFMSSFFIRNYAFFPFLEKLLLSIIEWLERVMCFLTNQFNFSLITGRLPLLIIVLLSMNIFIVIRRIEMKKRPNLISVGLIFSCLFYHQLSPVGYVLMLDIGQGDSILIKEPITGKVSMIDTGGVFKWAKDEEWKESETAFSVAQEITVPALKSFGISKIDRLYITHADADHSGEIETLASEIPIQEIVATHSTFNQSLIYEQIVPFENMNRILVDPPEILSLPTQNTLALYPLSKQYKENNNNQSLVLYVTLGDDKWLFTGDIEGDAERNLLQEYSGLSVDYLKVSHHGSQTSTSETFLRQMKPKHALISVGLNNRYGHPHSEVIQRLEDSEATIYRTDEMGAIQVQYYKVPLTNNWYTKIKTVHKIGE